MTRALLLAFALAITGCSSSSAPAMDTASTMTIVETAVATPALSTLVTAVQAADLVETLNGPGPFTVFAPTNDAFDEVPDETLASLLQPQNQAQLQGLLTFHVVPGRLAAADLSDGQTLTTVNGADLEVQIRGGVVMIGDAVVRQADVFASNGVVHVIDDVLMP
ncbi:fasciclin domain-containing protein [Rubrivirga sp.]|uniref:fasciclin domain-containing protein n=1 Tax=Rubrivirga sp. TaxID=1885344 RepID=UPI003C76C683